MLRNRVLGVVVPSALHWIAGCMANPVSVLAVAAETRRRRGQTNAETKRSASARARRSVRCLSRAGFFVCPTGLDSRSSRLQWRGRRSDRHNAGAIGTQAFRERSGVSGVSSTCLPCSQVTCRYSLMTQQWIFRSPRVLSLLPPLHDHSALSCFAVRPALFVAFG